ncbi:hypothetical protein AMJ39_09735 [candidate division TA06 bacterium DG_24]|uniref:Uncharacterized protein n=1 Tax=candidate division TA06 bacterium DG_24 TaxID=1703770 RepID=A0A0S7WMZ3_UNCT6|nr:MAG: hypothetical protein AMJ39_09735 [candidate division TA06 bacterium DG_24]
MDLSNNCAQVLSFRKAAKKMIVIAKYDPRFNSATVLLAPEFNSIEENPFSVIVEPELLFLVCAGGEKIEAPVCK